MFLAACFSFAAKPILRNHIHMKPFPIGADWILIEETPRGRFSDEGGGKVMHAMPINDLDEHDTSITCWCQPIFDHRDLEHDDEIVVHRFMKKSLQ